MAIDLTKPPVFEKAQSVPDIIPFDDEEDYDDYDDDGDHIDESEEINTAKFITQAATGGSLAIAGLIGSACHVEFSGWLIFFGGAILYNLFG